MRRASMGPRRMSRRYEPLVVARQPLLGLQWGRGSSAAAPLKPEQWLPGYYEWLVSAAHQPRILATRSSPAATARASMGPRLMSRGYETWTPSRPGTTGFNGAAADEPRIPEWDVEGLRITEASMGPRLMSRGSVSYTHLRAH